MWELDYKKKKKKESWVPKNWCFWTVLLKTLQSPLDCKEIQLVHHKGNHSCIFIGRTDAEAEAPILWQPDVKNWLIWKDPDSGKDWRWEEKQKTEDELFGWYHLLKWTWVWVSSRSWWWTGKPGVLQSMGLSTVRHDWAIELTEPEITVTNILGRLFSRLLSWKDYYFGSVTCIGQPKKSYASFFVSILVCNSTFHGCTGILSCLILFKQFCIVWFSQIFGIVITSIINSFAHMPV